MAGGAKRIKSPASGNSGSDVLIDVLIQVYSFFKMQSLKQKTIQFTKTSIRPARLHPRPNYI